MNLKYCLTGMLLFSLKVWSQEVPLSVGDKMPAINIKTIFNSPAFESNPFSHSLVILDFMASNCSSCLKVLPRFDSIQKIYGNKIQIFLVTYEKKEKVKKFLQVHPEIKLPVIGEDTLLSKMFPHTFISHEVWIMDGIVKAITYPEYVNVENIATALSKNKIDWPVKDDKLHSAKVNNYFSIIDLYLQTYGEYRFPPGHIILDVQDMSRFIYPGVGYTTEWKEKNSFCYDSIFHVTFPQKKLPEKMRGDLDKYFGVEGRMEKRNVDCYVLQGADTTLHVGNISIHNLIYTLNQNFYGTPFFNEGNEKQMINIDDLALHDISLLQKELKKYSMVLTKQKCETDVLVIKDKLLTLK